MSLWRWGFPSSRERAAHIIGWRGLHPTGACSLPAGRAELSASPGAASLGSEAVRAIRARWITEASLRRVQRSELCWSSRSLLRGNAHPLTACGPPPLRNEMGGYGVHLCLLRTARFSRQDLAGEHRFSLSVDHCVVLLVCFWFTIRGVRTGKSPTLPNHGHGK